MSPLARAGERWPEPADPHSYRVAVRVLSDVHDLDPRDVVFLHTVAATAVEGSLSQRQIERLDRLAERAGIPI